MLNTRSMNCSGSSFYTPWHHAATHRHPWATPCQTPTCKPGTVVRRRRQAVQTAVLKIDDLPKHSTAVPPAPISMPSCSQGSEIGTTGTHVYVPPPVDRWHLDPVLMSGCEAQSAPLSVAVLLSGGVDSSLALKLLVAAGHSCKAYYLQIWFQEDFRNFWDSCPWEEDLKFAQQVCDALNVPLEIVPMTSAYWERVVAASVEEIRAGRTPNPDILCNSRVKFGAFVDHLERQGREGGPVYDRVASGHYARVVRREVGGVGGATGMAGTASGMGMAGKTGAGTGLETACVPPTSAAHVDSNGGASLATATTNGVDANGVDANGVDANGVHHSHGADHKDSSEANGSNGVVANPAAHAYLCLTPDAVKDQTYFLALLSPRQLAKAMFPLGGLTKPQVRALAAAAGLATQSRKDSQGICFLGKVKFPEFVKEHLGEWQGLIVEEEEEEEERQGQGQGQGQGHSQIKGQESEAAELRGSSLHAGMSSNGTHDSSDSSSGSGNGIDSDNVVNSTGRVGQSHAAPLQESDSKLSAGAGSKLRAAAAAREGQGKGGSNGGAGANGGRGGMAPTLARFGGRRVLGLHTGYWFYTVGQRGGIKLPGGPWYVVRKDCEMNVVYVSRRYYETNRRRNALTTGRFSWLSDLRPDPTAPLACKVRHGPHAYHCHLRPNPSSKFISILNPDPRLLPAAGQEQQHLRQQLPAQQFGQEHQQQLGQQHQQQQQYDWSEGALVVLDGSDQGLAAGQYAVLYQHGVCLGSAQIEACAEDVEWKPSEDTERDGHRPGLP